jgi:hypothetical protein
MVKNCHAKGENLIGSNKGMFVGEIEECINSLAMVRPH